MNRGVSALCFWKSHEGRASRPSAGLAAFASAASSRAFRALGCSLEWVGEIVTPRTDNFYRGFGQPSGENTRYSNPRRRHKPCLRKPRLSREEQEERHEEFIASIPQLRCAAKQGGRQRWIDPEADAGDGTGRPCAISTRGLRMFAVSLARRYQGR